MHNEGMFGLDRVNMPLMWLNNHPPCSPFVIAFLFSRTILWCAIFRRVWRLRSFCASVFPLFEFSSHTGTWELIWETFVVIELSITELYVWRLTAIVGDCLSRARNRCSYLLLPLPLFVCWPWLVGDVEYYAYSCALSAPASFLC